MQGQTRVEGNVIYRDNGDGTETVVGYVNQQPRSSAPQVVREAPPPQTAPPRPEAREDRAEDEATALRKEFFGSKAAQEYGIALGTFNSSLTTRPTAEGDQALITNFARMLDPNSVVRESEFATAAGNEAAFQRLLTNVKRQFEVDGAGRLSDQGRDRLRQEMRNLVVNRFKMPYDQAREQYTNFARIQQVDPYLVVGEPLEAAFPAGILDAPEAPANQYTPATGGTQVQDRIPAEYQQEHYNYLQQNWGQIDPQEYAVFRSQLDQKYGLEPNPVAYAQAVPSFNQMAQQGGTPQQLGAVPDPQAPLQGIDAIMNQAAQSPLGTFQANMGNAIAAGLPARFGGQQDNLEMLREINPGSSMAGEIAGNVIGSYGAGGIMRRVAPLIGAPRIGSPAVADTAYSAFYGATQDGAQGAIAGGLGALGGAYGGRVIGGAFPDTFAGGTRNQIRAGVPDEQQLRQQAAREYVDVEARGEIAGPDATTALTEGARALLQREGRITPQGRMIDLDTPSTRAMTLLDDFAGQPMTPTQAGTVRNVLSEGLAGQDASQRRISGMLLDEFDQWAEPVLPGISVPRETAKRYLQGAPIKQAMELADANVSKLTQSGRENALRGAFRDLDRSAIRGKNRFDPEVIDAIELASRGDNVTNAARAVGKYAPTGVIPVALGGGAAGMLGNAIGGPGVGVGLGLLAMGAGSAGRALATNRTEQAATDALLTAYGGPAFTAMMKQAEEEARMRAGMIGGGLFGGAAVQGNRQYGGF